MLPSIFFLTFLFAASAMANKAAGKWQLLFFYHVYRYQVDVLGFANTEMALGCSQSGVADLESFVKNNCVWNKHVRTRDASGNFIEPMEFHQEPNFDGVDWKGIGDGETFNLDRFSNEMDRVGFMGGFENAKLFKNWNVKDNNFVKVMSEAERIVEKAQEQLTAKGQPILNARYQALQDVLEIHANARRYDQAMKLVAQFTKEVCTPTLGDQITRPHVPPYRKMDAEATVKDNGLVGKKADRVRNWVAKENASGKTKGHFNAISKATDMQKKFAAACASK